MECCHNHAEHAEDAVHHSHEHQPPNQAAPAVIRFILPALVAVAVVLGLQTFQLASLQQKASAKTVAPASAPAAAAASAPLPSSVQNLPNMVGGC